MQLAKLSQKEQKYKLSEINKENFITELLTARPKDYQERNWFYHQLSQILSYPLQFVSILAGSYLLFDLAKFIWHIDLDSVFGIFIFLGCMILFFGIEALRRWLVNTTGYHYLATFRREQTHLIKGEWLKTKMYILILISCVLISSGTFGTYQYTKHNKPQAAILDIKKETSLIDSKIDNEKKNVENTDENIKDLMQSKKEALNNKNNYAIWNGQEFMLPEAKERIANYDKQIQALTNQRQKHQELLHHYEGQRLQKERKTESKNAQILAENEYSTEIYAAACAGIWLSFEFMLVFLLSYSWIYKYGVKREVLLVQLNMKHKSFEAKNSANLSKNDVATIKSEKILPKNLGLGSSENFLKTPITHKSQVNKVSKEDEKKEIGFQVKNDKINTEPQDTYHFTHLPNTNVAPQVIIQEVPVDVVKEVYIEKEIPVEVTIKDPDEGFVITCAYCGKTETKKRKAKYCSDKCRYNAWKESKEK